MKYDLLRQISASKQDFIFLFTSGFAQMDRRLRKDAVIEHLADTEMKFKSEEHLDLSKLQQLPSYYYVLARYHTLKLQLPKTKPNKHSLVVGQLANELRYIWIYMNVPPVTWKTVRKYLNRLLDKYLDLKKPSIAQRKDTWLKSFNEIYKQLDNGFDILATEESVVMAVKKDH